jgi:leucyl-tRNA synthetase
MIGGEDQARTCFFHIRMMAKALKQAGVVEYDEPVDTLLALGMVKADGRKMSKSEGNVVGLEGLLRKHGADALRFGILSAAAPDSDINWSENVVRQASTFLRNVWQFFERNQDWICFDDPANTNIDQNYSLSRKLLVQVQTALARTTEALCQNYCHLAASNIAHLFERIERYEDAALRRRAVLDTRDRTALSAACSIFLRVLNPLCPHIAEELWARCHGSGFIAQAAWPIPVRENES